MDINSVLNVEWSFNFVYKIKRSSTHFLFYLKFIELVYCSSYAVLYANTVHAFDI